MTPYLADLRAQLDTPERRKFIRYTVASAISVAVTVTLQLLGYGVFHVKGGWSGFIASAVAAFPSYYLNRSWVWGKSGRSHLTGEVLPFWGMALFGVFFSMAVSHYADQAAHSWTDSHPLRTLVVTGSSVVGFGVLWLLKYVIFNKILFVHHPEDLDPVLDGRTGFPT